MNKKLVFELVIIILVAVLVSYFFGLNNGAQAGLQLAEKENKYKDLFLLEPSNNAKTSITQEFIGNVKSIEDNKMIIDVNGDDAIVYLTITTTFQDCKGILNSTLCEAGNDGVAGKNVKIRAEGISGSYYASVVSY